MIETQTETPLPSIIESQQETKSTVILFHGLGQTSEALMNFGQKVHESFPNTKVILPNAPIREMGYKPGVKRTAWFNVFGFTLGTKEDLEGIKQAGEKAAKIIEEEKKQDRIVIIGGISQGGVLSLQTALRSCKSKIDGVLALSCYIPLISTLGSEFSEINKRTPILFCHGDEDDVIPLSWAEGSHNVLSEKKFNSKLNIYKGLKHNVCDEEMKDIMIWFGGILTKKDTD
eukprot:Anaeramoba_ignava/a4639_105.p1 GENE.a4639_105~~a4639_105.p1  ORF type:complete len:230 (+),score=76.82 a4639_105:140-829(+)